MPPTTKNSPMRPNGDYHLMDYEERFTSLESARDTLESDVSKIHDTLMKVATKEDINDLSLKMEKSINGILRDALNAVPAKHAAWWTAICACAAIVAIVIPLLHG